MTIALTGGTGFVGNHLRPVLWEGPVTLLGRRQPALLMENERWRDADMAHPISPVNLEGARTLCHLAFSMTSVRENVRYNRHLLDAANASPSVDRVVLMSSTSVYGEGAAGVVDEESPCKPVGEYARTKLACETLWREGLREGCALTVLRPSEIIGPGGKGLLSLVEDALKRPVAGAFKRSLLYHRPLHYVAVSNVAAAVLFCLRRPPTSETFIVSGDHEPENKGYAAMQDAIRAARGLRPLPGPPAPRWALRVLGRATGRPLEARRVYSSRKLRDAGFENAVSLREEVRRVVQGAVGETTRGPV